MKTTTCLVIFGLASLSSAGEFYFNAVSGRGFKTGPGVVSYAVGTQLECLTTLIGNSPQSGSTYPGNIAGGTVEGRAKGYWHVGWTGSGTMPQWATITCPISAETSVIGEFNSTLETPAGGSGTGNIVTFPTTSISWSGSSGSGGAVFDLSVVGTVLKTFKTHSPTSTGVVSSLVLFSPTGRATVSTYSHPGASAGIQTYSAVFVALPAPSTPHIVPGPLTGSVTMQGVTDADIVHKKNLRYEMRSLTGVIVEESAISGIGLTASSAASSTGTVNVFAIADGCLRKYVGQYELDGSTAVSVAAVTLTNGDIDEDNSVSVFDYIFLSDAMDASAEDSDWTETDEFGLSNADADLDGDGVVSAFDYIILSDSFDWSGD